MEFQGADALFQRVDVMHDGRNRSVVAFGRGQFQQLAGVVEAVADAVQALDELGQACPLAAEILRALRIVPDIGTFQFPAYLFQALALGRVVKDTP